jgi:hypothetical protein
MTRPQTAGIQNRYIVLCEIRVKPHLVLYKGLVFSCNFPRRASKTVLRSVDSPCFNASVFLRFSSGTVHPVSDSSRSPNCFGPRPIDMTAMSTSKTQVANSVDSLFQDQDRGPAVFGPLGTRSGPEIAILTGRSGRDLRPLPLHS